MLQNPMPAIAKASEGTGALRPAQPREEPPGSPVTQDWGTGSLAPSPSIDSGTSSLPAGALSYSVLVWKDALVKSDACLSTISNAPALADDCAAESVCLDSRSCS